MADMPLDNSPKLRMAVIGCGPIGLLHARAIVESPSARLVAVCDVDRQRRTLAAERFQTSSSENIEHLLADHRLDAVTIATPDHLHVEPVLAAIAAGCHVFCEKPLAASVDEAKRLVQAADRRGVRLAVDYNRRFAFGYRTAKAWLEAGRIGRLRYVVLRVSNATPPAKVARHRHVIITTLLTHHLDLVRYLGGEASQVHALAGDEPDAPLVRTITLSLKLAGGAIATIVAAYRDGQSRTAEWLELGGSSGSIAVDDATRRVTLLAADQDAAHIVAPNHFQAGDAFYDSLVEHVQAFLDHLARGQQPPVTGADGLLSLKLAAAAVESLARGTTIEVPLP